MSWTSNLFVAFVLTTLTGSGVVLFWYLVGLAIDRIGYSQLLYRLLQWLPLFFFVPFLYVSMILQMDMRGSVKGFVGLLSGAMQDGIETGAIIWLTGMLLLMLYFGVVLLQFFRSNRACLDADLETRQLLEDCCALLNIHQKVGLRRSYGQRIPMVYGCAHPVILLPVENYPPGLLRMIFIHELLHIKHRDLPVKMILVFMLLLQWINPFVWWVSELLKRWSEYACDEEACQVLGESRAYGEAIFALAMNEKFLQSQIFVGLLEDKHQVKRRIKRMNKNQKRKKKSRLWLTSLLALMLTFSSVTAFAAGNAVVDGYEKLYRSSREDVVEENNSDSLEEFTEPYDTTGLREEIGEVTSIGRGSSTSYFDWDVEDGVFRRTYFFSASSGGSITVAASLTPTDKTVKVGIVTPSGINRYVNATEEMSHKFTLNETGSYCVFVENNSGVTVNVAGHYTVRTP